MILLINYTDLIWRMYVVTYFEDDKLKNNLIKGNDKDFIFKITKTYSLNL